MFDLEKAIAHWRGELFRVGIQSSEIIAELETHLRDDIERQTRSGRNMPEAFSEALHHLGSGAALKHEFTKVRPARSVMEKLRLGICLVLIGLILFLSGVAIVLCYESWGERIMASAAIFSVLLVAVGWSHLVPFLPIIENRRFRWATGLSCIGCGVVVSNLFCTFVLPHFEFAPDHQLPAIGVWAVFLLALFGSTGVGLLLSKRQREMWGMTRHTSITALVDSSSSKTYV